MTGSLQAPLDVAIIGAGMTGIACARQLAQAGLGVALFDKGRGIGGRMATRRAPEGLIFDHGAQLLRPRSLGFAAALASAQAAGHAAEWALPDGPALVGQPGMAGLMAGLAQGLTVHQGAAVTQIAPDAAGWRLTLPEGEARARHLVLTIPAPQALTLIGGDHPLAPGLSGVRMAASITLMAAFDADAPRPFLTRQGTGALAWIAQDGAKPGRAQGGAVGGPVGWVVQSDAAFSATHIDRPFEALAAMLAPMLCAQLGADPAHLRHAAAHRWLYAQADRPLGQPFLGDPAARLWIGGDWCLGPLAEDGWTSGEAIARQLLARA